MIAELVRYWLMRHNPELRPEIGSPVLFKGHSCFPLSPGVTEEGKKFTEKNDQFILILRTLGKKAVPCTEFNETQANYFK